MRADLRCSRLLRADLRLRAQLRHVIQIECQFVRVFINRNLDDKACLDEPR